MKPPVPFDYDGPAPETPPVGLREPADPPATTGISGEQDKRFQAMLRAKNLTFEDVFWIVCGDKCPTCDVTRPTKDALDRLAKLEAFAKSVVDGHVHELPNVGSSERVGDCDGPLHCIVCAAEEALK